jgi:aerobic-type carbon monoxide dehydrogenase small subunit (CoxS/CutS family)
MAVYKLSVNGSTKSVEAEPDMPLLWVLRDLIGLTGTKYGCGIGACGACMVLVDGVSQRSCQMAVSEVGKKKITTIEGLNKAGLHRVQKAWMEHDVPQCGFCQSGQIIAAVSLLSKNPRPSDAQIREAMDGNLCRCGTYHRVLEAVKSAAKESK